MCITQNDKNQELGTGERGMGNGEMRRGVWKGGGGGAGVGKVV